MLALLIPALLDCTLPIPPLEISPLIGALKLAVVDHPPYDDSTRSQSYLRLETEKEYGMAPYNIYACVSVDDRTITIIVAGVYPPSSGVDMPRFAEAELALPSLADGTYRVRVLAIGRRQDLTLRVTPQAYDLRGSGSLAIGQHSRR